MGQENVEYVVSAKDLASDVFQRVEKGLKGIGEQATDLKSKVGSLAATVGVGVFAHMIDESIRGEAELVTFGQIAGVTAAKFSGLGEAAALSGTPLNEVAGLIAKLSQAVGEAKLGNEGKKSLFTSLGIDPNDGRDAADRLLQVAKAVTNMADQDVAAYATKQLLNKSFAEARPLLEQLAEQESITARSTTEAALAAKQYEDNTRKMAYESTQAKIALANDLLPSINNVVEAMVRAQKEGGALAAIIAGIQTAATGTDQYKNDKELVELTERKLQIQNKIDELRRDGDMPTAPGKNDSQLAYWQAELGKLNEQLQTTLTYRKELAKPQNTGGVQKEDGMDNSAIDDIVKGASAEKALRARMEFEKNYTALIAASQAAGQRLAATMKLNNMLAQETYKQGEIDQVEYLREIASNDDAVLARKIVALQEEQALARKKGDNERVQITANGIAAAEAERQAQQLINKVRIDAAREAERDESRLFLQKLMKDVDQIRQETMTEKQLETRAHADRLNTLGQAYANELVSTAEYQSQREALEMIHQAKLGDLVAQGQMQRRQIDEMSGFQQLEFFSSTLASVTSAAAQHNRTFFELNKAANISNAIISTYAGATKALEWGIPLGPIFAGIIAAAGFANVQAISAQQFGGGGGSSGAGVTPTFDANPNTGLPVPVAAPAGPAAAVAAPLTKQVVHISIQGSLLSAELIRDELIPLINEAVGDGVELIASVTR
jgi:hypothetical protein